MKKVITKQEPQSTTLLKNCHHTKYYGILQKTGDKGFLSRRQYGIGEYFFKCASNLTEGNHWPALKEENFTFCIRNAILVSGNEVFEFDTPQELFAWLAE